MSSRFPLLTEVRSFHRQKIYEIAEKFEDHEKGWTGVDESKVQLNKQQLENAVELANKYGVNGEKMAKDALFDKIQNRLNSAFTMQRNYLASIDIPMDNRSLPLDEEALEYVSKMLHSKHQSPVTANLTANSVRSLTKEVDRIMSVAKGHGFDADMMHETARAEYIINKPPAVTIATHNELSL